MKSVSTAGRYQPAVTASARRLPQPMRSPLKFRRVTLADMADIDRVLRQSGSMTCDYTVGGIYMWIDYFRYRFCIYNDTLFISGVQENHLDKPAFSCPIGKMSLPASIELLRDYCRERDMPLRFSAIPADRLTCFTAFNPRADVEELADWSDYVYDLDSFATLAGKKMSKKRNHFNRFMAEHPQAVLEPLTADNVDEVRRAMMEWERSDEGSDTATTDTAETRCEEMREVLDVLDNLEALPFHGALLRTAPGADIVAFTLAEVIDTVAFVHIEKMDHRVAGAGETIAHLFAADLKAKHPDLKYLNREEDCGDEGLRRAKESWHPLMLLKKFNIAI